MLHARFMPLLVSTASNWNNLKVVQMYMILNRVLTLQDARIRMATFYGKNVIQEGVIYLYNRLIEARWVGGLV